MYRLFASLVSLSFVCANFAWAQDLDLRGVGLLDLGTAGGCTGTLIASDLVLTAGHCMLGKIDDEPITAERVSFRPATATGRPDDGFVAESFAVHPVFLFPGLGPVKKISRDLALVKLAEHVPAEQATPIQTALLEDIENKGFVISFRGRKSTARQRACTPIAGAPGIITLGCEVKKGESGSPFLIVDNGAVFVVGVISASSKQGRQPIALAADLGEGFASMLEAFRPLD